MSNGYISGRKDQALFTLEPVYLRTFAAPFKQDGLKVTLAEVTGFVGTAALLLLPLAIVGFRRKKQLFWIVSTAVLGILIYTRSLNFIFSRMPLVNTSMKSRLISILPFTLVILAAIQLDDVIRNGERYRRYFWRFLYYAAGTGAAALIAKRYPEQPHPALPLKAAVMLFAGMELIILFSESRGEGSFIPEVFRMARPWLRLFAGGLLLIYTIIQMGLFARDNMFYIPKAAPVMPEATEGIYHLQYAEPNRVYPYTDWTFFPNTNVFYDIRSLTLHSFAATNKDMDRYIRDVDGAMHQSPTHRMGTKIDHYTLLRYAGVDTLFTRNPLGTEEENGYALIYEGETDGMKIFKTGQYHPRFFLGETVTGSETEKESLALMKQDYVSGGVFLSRELTDPGLIRRLADTASPLAETEGMDIIKDKTDDITLRVNTEKERLLVFNEYNDGNWKVSVDGKWTEDIKANYLFNGVVVPAGEHEVRFYYDPPGLRAALPSGLFILIITVLAAAVLGIRELRIKDTDKDTDKVTEKEKQ